MDKSIKEKDWLTIGTANEAIESSKYTISYKRDENTLRNEIEGEMETLKVSNIVIYYNEEDQYNKCYI